MQSLRLECYSGEDSDGSSRDYSRSTSPSVLGQVKTVESGGCAQQTDIPEELLKVVKQSSAALLASGEPQRLPNNISFTYILAVPQPCCLLRK